MASLSDKYVPSEGSKPSKILIVGEAPGSNEELEGRPFVGKAGQLLTRYLGRLGVQRDEVYLTNLCHYRPKGNDFKNALGSRQLDEGLEELAATIETVNPNVIIACGNWPMYFLTGCTGTQGKAGTGISNWRGSFVPTTDEFGLPAGRKVLITFHPAYIVRPQGFGWHPVFLNDLAKAIRQQDFPDIRYPVYEEHIDPPDAERIAEEMAEAEWLTIDIETFGNSLACVGFADGTDRGLCITFQYAGGWDVAEWLIRSPAKKIFQFGTFDINWLDHFMSWETHNYAFDTYIAAANIHPEFPKGLDFLTSIYTDFPFYKEERKEWKETGDMTTLWQYNIKDVIATHTIAMKQMEELYGHGR